MFGVNNDYKMRTSCIFCNTENNYSININVYVLSIACI